MLIAILGLVVGGIVGVRFTVLALVPLLVGVASIAILSARLAESTSLGFAQTGLLLACLQVGYLGGAALRLALTHWLESGGPLLSFIRRQERRAYRR
jgi:hypothetical protein